ncbi:MAG: multifunctional CCA tRNA nucleotidyl transferase/2'3'-cyclic phosphodiesterase/2'nucleotidase/phosphatase [Alphaproteobacteria bacterium]|nr:multifunctional CCA tRNA nucleotidyl transferase/2'3'-cyclic phosphodiesterase/2'nucleotidase/phosphatase [Alphaproteobacteria bacterium]MDI9329874.1 multifunctional CCA tRNA nucleotidyl transferase/2'3'-cyclic phosphodiesterase/2'nucleotidase/phosphatase [Alphaproteobacteria bacterium]
MKTYLVGGAVRDGLLGLSGSDRDWVVVGATPEQMLTQGFAPVGRDFPVFLHPETHEEFALARTERKTAPGYKGFVVHASPDVTLEQDLARRDLTINAMARDEQGQLIDPYGGQADLQARVLRHVTEAFREDPVRILRLARFAARFPDFEVAPDTLALAQEMVRAGEVDALVPERVWQELERGLMARQPSRMARVLVACGAWLRLWPELAAQTIDHLHALVLLDRWQQANLAQRWTLWCHGATPQAVGALGQRYRVPTEVTDLAGLWSMHRSVLHSTPASAGVACEFLHRIDAMRRPERAQQLLEVAFFLGMDAATGRHAQWWQQALKAMLEVDAKAVNQAALAQGLRGPVIGMSLAMEQIRAIAARCPL